jgi:hypothetical protein
MYIFENEEERRKFYEKWNAERHAEDPERYPTPEERAERERQKREAWQKEMLANSRDPYELDIVPATIVYIAVLIGSLIFKEFLYIWCGISIWYWKRFFK